MVETIFYDGNCGLCHGFVKFVVRRDRAEQFEFAPLFGQHFTAKVPQEQHARIPDSVVVLAADSRLLVKSAAVRYVLRHLGGVWGVVAAPMHVLPLPVMDFF